MSLYSQLRIRRNQAFQASVRSQPLTEQQQQTIDQMSPSAKKKFDKELRTSIQSYVQGGRILGGRTQYTGPDPVSQVLIKAVQRGPQTQPVLYIDLDSGEQSRNRSVLGPNTIALDQQQRNRLQDVRRRVDYESSQRDRGIGQNREGYVTATSSGLEFLKGEQLRPEEAQLLTDKRIPLDRGVDYINRRRNFVSRNEEILARREFERSQQKEKLSLGDVGESLRSNMNPNTFEVDIPIGESGFTVFDRSQNRQVKRILSNVDLIARGGVPKATLPNRIKTTLTNVGNMEYKIYSYLARKDLSVKDKATYIAKATGKASGEYAKKVAYGISDFINVDITRNYAKSGAAKLNQGAPLSDLSTRERRALLTLGIINVDKTGKRYLFTGQNIPSGQIESRLRSSDFMVFVNTMTDIAAAVTLGGSTATAVALRSSPSLIKRIAAKGFLASLAIATPVVVYQTISELASEARTRGVIAPFVETTIRLGTFGYFAGLAAKGGKRFNVTTPSTSRLKVFKSIREIMTFKNKSIKQISKVKDPKKRIILLRGFKKGVERLIKAKQEGKSPDKIIEIGSKLGKATEPISIKVIREAKLKELRLKIEALKDQRRTLSLPLRKQIGIRVKNEIQQFNKSIKSIVSSIREYPRSVRSKVNREILIIKSTIKRAKNYLSIRRLTARISAKIFNLMDKAGNLIARLKTRYNITKSKINITVRNIPKSIKQDIKILESKAKILKSNLKSVPRSVRAYSTKELNIIKAQITSLKKSIRTAVTVTAKNKIQNKLKNIRIRLRRVELKVVNTPQIIRQKIKIFTNNSKMLLREIQNIPRSARTRIIKQYNRIKSSFNESKLAKSRNIQKNIIELNKDIANLRRLRLKAKKIAKRLHKSKMSSSSASSEKVLIEARRERSRQLKGRQSPFKRTQEGYVFTDKSGESLSFTSRKKYLKLIKEQLRFDRASGKEPVQFESIANNFRLSKRAAKIILSKKASALRLANKGTKPVWGESKLSRLRRMKKIVMIEKRAGKIPSSLGESLEYFYYATKARKQYLRKKRASFARVKGKRIIEIRGGNVKVSTATVDLIKPSNSATSAAKSDTIDAIKSVQNLQNTAQQTQLVLKEPELVQQRVKKTYKKIRTAQREVSKTKSELEIKIKTETKTLERTRSSQLRNKSQRKIKFYSESLAYLLGYATILASASKQVSAIAQAVAQKSGQEQDQRQEQAQDQGTYQDVITAQGSMQRQATDTIQRTLLGSTLASELLFKDYIPLKPGQTQGWGKRGYSGYNEASTVTNKFIYIPDLTARLFGERATKRRTRQLLAVGRVFTGFERRKLV